HTYQYFVQHPLPNAIAFRDSSNSYAVYAELGQRFFGEKLEWTLGIRNFHDNVKTQGDETIATQSHNVLARDFSATTPRAILTWRPNADLMVYGSYSQGFRSGWNQDPAVFTVYPQFPSVKPDTLDAYEVGTKGDLFGHRVSFDAAVYYINWRDIQQS